MTWLKALRLEGMVAHIIHTQEQNGVFFDLEVAKGHVVNLERMKDELYEEIRPYLATEVVAPYKDEVKTPWLKSGKYSISVTNWYGEVVPDIVGPFTRVEFQDPQIGSRVK